MEKQTILESLRRRGCPQRDVELAGMSRMICLALRAGRRQKPDTARR